MAGTALEAALSSVPIRVWEAVAPRRAFALCYHMVSDEVVPHVRPLFAYKTPGEFVEDVEYLRRRYGLVSEDGLARRLEGKDGGRRAAVAISFDDGLKECHSVVRPILSRSGMRAVFFLTTGCLDNRAMIYRHQAALCVHRILAAGDRERASLFDAVNHDLKVGLVKVGDLIRLITGLRADRSALLDEVTRLLGIDVSRYLKEHKPYLSRAQALELAADGHLLGAHGVTHRDFQVLSEQEIEEEVVQSCDTIASLAGQTPVPFAVPFTLDGLDRALLQRIRRAHPQVGWIYGTSGLRREPPGLSNRLVTDSPRGSRADHSNLPLLFRAAYASWARTAVSPSGGKIW